jgi:hypothetical protein
VVAERTPRGSRADFAHAVEVLAAISPGCFWRPVSERLMATLVTCPYETWERIFGQPDEVTVCGDESADSPVYTWTHVLSDGPVRCVGHLVERESDRWVVLTRVCLFQWGS